MLRFLFGSKQNYVFSPEAARLNRSNDDGFGLPIIGRAEVWPSNRWEDSGFWSSNRWKIVDPIHLPTVGRMKISLLPIIGRVEIGSSNRWKDGDFRFSNHWKGGGLVFQSLER